MFKRALVIGSEAFSRILDWQDRSTCVLFGDGAGAVVVEAQKLNGALTDRGILATSLRSDGRYRDKLYVDGGPSSTGTVGHVRMDGPEVFRHAVTKISEVIDSTLTQAGYKVSDIDWFVPHQANKRILDGAARKLGLDPDRIIVTVDKHANTSAASIPLALSQGRADGRIKTGDLVLLEAMGEALPGARCCCAGRRQKKRSAARKPHLDGKCCNISNLIAGQIDRLALARLAS